MNIHEIVIEEMERVNYTAYQMAKECKERGICSRSTFYNFYNGVNEIGIVKIGGILSLLELDIVRK